VFSTRSQQQNQMINTFLELSSFSVNLAFIQAVEWDKVETEIERIAQGLPTQTGTKPTCKKTSIFFIGCAYPLVLRSDASSDYDRDVFTLKQAMKHFTYPIRLTHPIQILNNLGLEP